tara:strand:+ start:152 stop:562 length:411 start_codon:yes stop_codon:yes gene_type:complete
MKYKKLLLASFVNKETVNHFLMGLKNNHDVEQDDVFCFEFSDTDYLLTYKIKTGFGDKFDIKKQLPKTVQIHKKKTTFFTINALNRLIERDCGLHGGNINHKEHNIDWGLYGGKIILLKNNMLDITDISRVFLSNS